PEAKFVAREALARGLDLDLLDPGSDESLDAWLPDTGWTILRDGRHELLFEHGPLGPDEQPGHGHSDALSFELFWNGVPVVLDTGASTYQPGPQRTTDRSVFSHAAVSVDGEGPDELWGAFRAGGRARVESTLPRSENGADLL